jgi:predicted ATP-dependent endonuclease of OLD family
MKYRSFTLKNYKGIKELSLSLDHTPLICLLGLNESGKTTLLEGIKVFYDLTQEKPLQNGRLNQARPKGSFFTGDIIFKAVLELDDEDRQHLFKGTPKKMQAKLTQALQNSQNTLDVEYLYPFNNNSFKGPSLRKTSLDTLITEDLTGFLQSRCPEILFYEDFTFALPEKITFGSLHDDTLLNEQWKKILNDVYKNAPEVQEDRTIESDIVDWLDQNPEDTDSIDQRVLLMESVLNTKIADKWKQLANTEKTFNFDKIKIKYDPTKRQFSLQVVNIQNQIFHLNERSNGCKWFFAFLLFTEFRKNRTRNPLFLLDEPASNMHASAQEQTLIALEALCDTASVIYSTHSPYLLSIKNFPSTYVVFNETKDETSSPHIQLEPYQSFSSKESPHDYARAALDHIRFTLPQLDHSHYSVFVEGWTDWNILYLLNALHPDQSDMMVYPCHGSGTMAALVSSAIARNKPFKVILDHDQGGEDGKKQLEKHFKSLVAGKIETLKESLNTDYKTIEDLFDEQDYAEIATLTGLDTIDKRTPKTIHKGIERLVFLIRQGEPLQGQLSRLTQRSKPLVDTLRRYN